VGSRDHAEIWAPDAWTAYAAQLDDADELAQAFEGLGI
jgi:DNA-binding transcriptional regulator/RsmH inhibitor MraZ